MSLQLIYGKHILIEFLYIKIQNTKKKDSNETIIVRHF